MEIFKLVAFSIVSVIFIMMLKSMKRDDFAVIVTVISAVVLLGVVMAKLESVISLLNDLVNKSGINKEYLILLLKVTGISYIVELATNICKDAGNNSIASKLEMIGKLSIVTLTVPILTAVISTILDIV